MLGEQLLDRRFAIDLLGQLFEVLAIVGVAVAISLQRVLLELLLGLQNRAPALLLDG